MTFSPERTVVLLALVACAGADVKETASGPCPPGTAAWTDSGHAFATVTEAISVVAGSETVHVCPGDYREGWWLLSGRDDSDIIRLEGAGLGHTIVYGVAELVLIAGPAGTIVVTDMTIRGGRPSDDCDEWDEEPCGNTATATGVGVSAADMVLERVVITDNEAQLGGGIWAGQGSSVLLRDSQVIGNRGTIGSGGAALTSPGTTLISEDTTWQHNEGGDIAFVTYAEDPDDVVVHGTFNADGATDFTCTFDTLTCE